MMDACPDKPLPVRLAHIDGEAGGASAACAALLPEPDQPLWGLDAVLAAALPEGEDSLPARALEILQGCLRGPAPETDDAAVLLKELLAAVNREAGPNAAPLSVLLLRGDSYYAAVRDGAPLYLTRHDMLLPLAPAAQGAQVRSGRVKDGDAFLLFTGPPGEEHEEEVRRILSESHLPGNACRRLAALRPGLGVALLYVGIGPVLAARLRAGWEAPAAAPAGPVVAGADPRGRLSPALMAGLAALGVLLGTGIGALLALARAPRPAAAPAPRSPVLAPVVRPGVPEPSVLPPVGRAAWARPAVPVAGTITPPPPAVPAADVPPPPHLLASGMNSQVALQVGMNAAREDLVLSINQGTLYSANQPQGIPSGEPLLLPLDASLRSRLQQPDAALQLVGENGRVAASVGSLQIRQMLVGRPVAVPNLAPGTYRLACTGGQGREPAQPFAGIRIAGIAELAN